MTYLVRNVLIVPATLDGSDRYHALLEARGYQIAVAEDPAGTRAQCRKNDFDFIVTGPLPGLTPKDLRSLGYPERVPVLCLDKARHRRDFSLDISILDPSAPDDTFLELCETLGRIKDLTKLVEEQRQRIDELEQTIGQQHQSMQQHNDFLNVLATRDGLTGLYNRRHLNKVLPREFERYLEQGIDLAMLIIDLDFFNEVNKKAGRTYGDFVLNDFAARLTSIITPQGTCFRFSGEEFVALLPDTSLAEAVVIAEGIRSNLAEKPFVQGTVRHSITVSIGIATLAEHQPNDPDHFITLAEQALFTAKAEGRNRVAVSHASEGKATAPPQQSIALVKQTLTRLLEKTKQSSVESLQLLTRDIVGKKNEGHIKSVKYLVRLLGDRMNLPEQLIQTFQNAITLQTSIRFLLHKETLCTNRELSSDEREEMNDFPFKLLEMTELFDFFAGERTILLHHAERYDGYGTPDGLKGDEIPLGARLFSLIDALAAMNEDRPYRKRLQPGEIIDQLVAGAGSQFDPELVRLTLDTVKNHRLLDMEPSLIDRALVLLKPQSDHQP